MLELFFFFGNEEGLFEREIQNRENKLRLEGRAKVKEEYNFITLEKTLQNKRNGDLISLGFAQCHSALNRAHWPSAPGRSCHWVIYCFWYIVLEI